jgi:hypothetical protein
MSMSRRHDKSPTKQYRPVHAPVSGYPGHNDPAEFNQTAKVSQPVPTAAAAPPQASPGPIPSGELLAGEGSR